MTARSIRRAAERQAIKRARKQANQANAQLSTGPRTDAGKAVSSLNAIKTGLTGRTVLLPSDDTAAYQHHVALYESELQPVGLRERELVQQIADAQWRLQRIPKLEMALYAKGRAEFAEEGSELSPDLIEAEIYLRYEKSLRNLHLQESRLRRQREKDTAELKALQAQRKEEQNDLGSFLQAPQVSLRANEPRCANEPQQTEPSQPNVAPAACCEKPLSSQPDSYLAA